MVNTIFVAPYFMDATTRFVRAVAELPGVNFGLVSVDGVDKLPAELRSRVKHHAQIRDGLDSGQILGAIETLQQSMGPVERVVGTLEQLQVPLGQVRDHLNLPGLGEAASLNFRDKARMKTVLAEHGLPCAKHALAHDAAEARAFAARFGFPLVIKPPDGAGASSTFRVQNNDELEQCVQWMKPSPENPALLEEFVTGREHSLDSVCIDGSMVWSSISHYSPTPLEVLSEPWIQWCVLIPREVENPRYDAIRQAAAHALPILGLKTGLSHMEWFLREDGSVAISEVGARPPGAQFTTLISYAHDFDLNRAWAKLMVFDEFEIRHRPYAAGAAYLRGQGRGKVASIVGLERAKRELGHLVVDFKLPQVGQTPSGSYEGEGYVILRHPETAVVEEGLRRLVSMVRVELG